MNTSYFLVKEGQVVPPFVKVSFEFSSSFRESVVRRTNTAESNVFSFFASFYRCNVSFFKYKFQIVTFLFFTPVF